jgi:hypothetical protein
MMMMTVVAAGGGGNGNVINRNNMGWMKSMQTKHYVCNLA